MRSSDEDVVRLAAGRRQPERGNGVGRNVHHVALRGQHPTNELAHLGLVFDNEDPHAPIVRARGAGVNGHPAFV